MDAVIRGSVIYLFLMLIFKVAGKRTLAQSTNFDLVMLLILSETTQQAMVDQDHSVMNAVLLITTLVGLSVLMSWVKQHFKKAETWLEGKPLIVMEDGTMHHAHMKRERVDVDDILAAARENHGIDRLEEIRIAVVERDGSISIIPRKK